METEFERQFRALYMPLCMFALRITEDTDTANDAVCDAFEAVWQRISGGFQPEDFKAYMYRSVRNRALRLTDRQEESVEEFAEKWASEEEIDTSVRDAKLWKAVGELPTRQREAFLLSKRDGLTYREIAERMGISEKTVEHQISAAMRKLREALKGSSGIFILFFW